MNFIANICRSIHQRSLRTAFGYTISSVIMWILGLKLSTTANQEPTRQLISNDSINDGRC
jgi:hypothetical protein